MDTAKLDLFLKIAETENLSQAARELGYTQCGASHTIRSLEEELGGVKLFTSGREGSLLTPAGQSALSSAKEILYWESQMKKDIQKAIHDVSVLRVAFLPSLAKLWMLPIIDLMRTRHPGVRFETIVGDNRSIIQWINSGDVDCGFAWLSKGSTLRSLFVCSDPFVAVLSKDHPLAAKDTISIKDLEPYCLIRIFWDVFDDIINEISAFGVQMRSEQKAGEIGELFRFVDEGAGISVMPEALYAFGEGNVTCRPLKENLKRGISIAVHQSKSTSPLVQSLHDVTIELLNSGVISMQKKVSR